MLAKHALRQPARWHVSSSRPRLCSNADSRLLSTSSERPRKIRVGIPRRTTPVKLNASTAQARRVGNNDADRTTPTRSRKSTAERHPSAGATAADTAMARVTPVLLDTAVNVPPPHLPRLNDIPMLTNELQRVLRHSGPMFSNRLPPYYALIQHPDELRMDRIPSFITSSRDSALLHFAAKQRQTAAASTSSSTSLLGHLHFAWSGHRPIDLQHFSNDFHQKVDFPTASACKPASVILRRRRVKDGNTVLWPTTSIDDLVNAHETSSVTTNSSDKHDSVHTVWALDNENEGEEDELPNKILIDLGNTMERMMTMKPADFNRIMLKRQNNQQSNPHVDSRSIVDFIQSISSTSPASSDESTNTTNNNNNNNNNDDDYYEMDSHRNYAYLKTQTLLYRSQLDCHDPSLSSPIFDLKTRATNPIRNHVADYKKHLDYEIVHLNGFKYSFEREWYDMARTAFLKYSLQCRLGGMGGIIVAYHNTQTVFGYEYIKLQQIDQILSGGPARAQWTFHGIISLFDIIVRQVVNEIELGAHQSSTETARLTFASDHVKPNDVFIYLETLPLAHTDQDKHLPFAQWRSIHMRLDSLSNKALMELAKEVDIQQRTLSSPQDFTDRDRAILLSQLEAYYSAKTRPLPTLSYVHHLVANKQIRKFRLRLEHGRASANNSFTPVLLWSDYHPGLRTRYYLTEETQHYESMQLAQEYQFVLANNRMESRDVIKQIVKENANRHTDAARILTTQQTVSATIATTDGQHQQLHQQQITLTSTHASMAATTA